MQLQVVGVFRAAIRAQPADQAADSRMPPALLSVPDFLEKIVASSFVRWRGHGHPLGGKAAPPASLSTTTPAAGQEEARQAGRVMTPTSLLHYTVRTRCQSYSGDRKYHSISWSPFPSRS